MATQMTDAQTLAAQHQYVEQPEPDDRISKSLIGSIIAVGSLAFIGILTETVMTVLFPHLMEEFNVSTATVQWITTIYLLVVGATMPLSSYLKRRFTMKSLFVAAVIFAVLGSLIMIVGNQFWILLVARVIQGIGSGLATPLMINIILEQSPRSKVGRLMGVGSLVITVAPAIGPTVGGAVASALPWRAIFMIVIPIIVCISLPVGLVSIRQSSPREETKLNPLQFVAIVFALAGLVLALNQAGVAISDAVSGTAFVTSCTIAVVSLLIGIASLIFFAWSSRRSYSPLIRLGWLRDPCVVLHLFAYTLLPMVGIGFGYVITNLAQFSMHTDSLVAGMLVLPGALIGAFFAPVGGMVYDKIGARIPVLSAFAVAFIAVAFMLVFSQHMTPLLLAALYFVFGIAYAFGFSTIMTNGIARIHHEFAPDGNAVFNTALQFGGAAGTTLFSTVFAIAQAGHGDPGSASFTQATTNGGTWTFAVMLVIVGIAWIALFRAFSKKYAR